MRKSTQYLPLILAAGFISTAAFGQNSNPTGAEQKAARAEIEQLTQRIQALSKKLGPDSNMNITVIERKGNDGNQIERRVLVTDNGGKGMRWVEDGSSQKHREMRTPGPRIGLGVVMAPNDAAGVKIAAVSPKSPAQTAGLLAGDILTSVDGKPVSGKQADGMTQARKALADLKEGQTVKIGYNRAGKAGIATVKAAKIEPQIVINRSQRMAPMPGQSFAFATRWNGLNMADLNPQLGRYFGASTGVLVLSPKSEFPQLQAGDVIIKVDGKSVSKSRDVMQALRGKKEGDKVTVNILRDRKAQAVNIAAPKARAFNMPPPPPMPPMPPMPPAPPKSASNMPAPPAPPAPPRMAMFIADGNADGEEIGPFEEIEISTDGSISSDWQWNTIDIEGDDIRIETK